MTGVICWCVYSILEIYSLDRGRWVQPPHTLCNFGPSGTDAINVPGIVQDVRLHKRLPGWCCPVISFRVHNIMWRWGVPHSMFHLRGPTMSLVSTHPHSQAVMFFQHPKLFSLMVRSLKKKKAIALLHQVLFKYFKCKGILHSRHITWIQG